MSRERFPLTSDQLEVLLAFSRRKGLADLATELAKDPSVVSRHLQRIAETLPVIEKLNARWELTECGHEVVQLTKDYVAALDHVLSGKMKSERIQPYLSEDTLLMVINAQNGLSALHNGESSKSEAEENIENLLMEWREKKRPVLHVRHVSENPQSPFYAESAGVGFMPKLSPSEGEDVIDKAKSSAFTGTKLAEYLTGRSIENLVLTGFTANDCIDATARTASDLGFTVAVVDDATAMFDFNDLHGRRIKAVRVHALTMANLNATCARILRTQEILQASAKTKTV